MANPDADRDHSPSAPTRRLWAAVSGEAAGGLILLAVAAIALILANSPLASAYHDAFQHPLGWTPIARLDSLHRWIDDGLMALFFLVVGLEIKREMLWGELADPAHRRLPVIAAVCGMAVPAIVYLAIAGHLPQLRRGWAIPGATDIAFAVGIVALAGPRVPASVRLFLLTVAIVDDLGAVAIIAVFYTGSISIGWFAAAVGVLGVMLVLARAGVRSVLVYMLATFALWLCMLWSGIHPTIAGVAAGLAIPSGAGVDKVAGADGGADGGADDGAGSRASGPLERIEHALTPWTTYLIVPLFALANAGVGLGGNGLQSVTQALPLAIAAGLFVGKQAGVMAAIWLADRSGFAPRPSGASWRQLWGVAILCGIGFTMSLFIAGLAFGDAPQMLDQAKLGVVTGTLLSIVAGWALLRFAPPAHATPP